MSTQMPRWMAKHPCQGCKVGYGQCAQGLKFSLMCCRACSHPSRWQADPWTAEDLAEMNTT